MHGACVTLCLTAFVCVCVYVCVWFLCNMVCACVYVPVCMCGVCVWMQELC